MFTIALRELRSLFLSPLAWSILGVVQMVLAIVFASRVSLFLEPEVQAELARIPNPPGVTDIVVTHLYVWLAIVMLLASPLLTMRLISDERRNKTLPLLLSSPVSMTEIVLGKYLGLMSFFMIMLIMVTLMPLSLLVGGTLDYGQLLGGILGIALLIGAFTAIGLYISTLTSYPTVAAIGTFGALLFLWIIDWAGDSSSQSGLFAYLSITNHYQTLLQGLFNTKDVIYYLLVITLFLILSIQRLDAERI